ncbi:Actin interacting protein 3 C-terminal domain-containing protein [Plasmodiophora brassicae]
MAGEAGDVAKAAASPGGGDPEQPPPAPVVEAAPDLTDLFDVELKFEFRKLTHVLSQIMGVVHDVRCEQSRMKADVELLFRQCKRLDDNVESALHSVSSVSVGGAGGPARDDAPLDQNKLLERIAGIDNRVRTAEGKLAQLTSPLEVKKAKKLAKDVESVTVRVQVLERVTSMAFNNMGAGAVTQEELRQRLTVEQQQQQQPAPPNDVEDVGDGDVAAEDDGGEVAQETAAAVEADAPPKAKRAAGPAKARVYDGTGGVDTFLALAKVEKVENIVLRMKETQQEFQLRVNQDHHDSMRGMHELKELVTDAMKRSEEIAALVEHAELRANKDIVRQSEQAAVTAIKAWQEDQAVVEEANADKRLKLVKTQVRQLQTALKDELKNIVETDPPPTSTGASHDQQGVSMDTVAYLHDMIKGLQSQNQTRATAVEKEVASIKKRLLGIQQSIEDITRGDEQLEAEVLDDLYEVPQDEFDFAMSAPEPAAQQPVRSDAPDAPLSNASPVPAPAVQAAPGASAEPSTPAASDDVVSQATTTAQEPVAEAAPVQAPVAAAIVELVAPHDATPAVPSSTEPGPPGPQQQTAAGPVAHDRPAQSQVLVKPSPVMTKAGTRPAPRVRQAPSPAAASDETTRRILVQYRLALKAQKERIDKQSGDLNRLSLYVYQELAPEVKKRHSATRTSPDKVPAPPPSLSISQPATMGQPVLGKAQPVPTRQAPPETDLDAEDIPVLRVRRRPTEEEAPAPVVERATPGTSWDKVIEKELGDVRRELACKPDIETIMGLFNMWSEQNEVPAATMPAAPQPVSGAGPAPGIMTKLAKDVATKADLADVARMEARIGLLYEQIEQVKANAGFFSGDGLDEDTMDYDEAERYMNGTGPPGAASGTSAMVGAGGGPTGADANDDAGADGNGLGRPPSNQSTPGSPVDADPPAMG